ncbi:MAG: hypothetical protein KDC45_08000 [Bacteroidetes bacterium]|nr:hypothetical protein [Bacteroidota bacterium]
MIRISIIVGLYGTVSAGLFGQQRSIRLETRMGTTSSVSALKFENILGNVTSYYKIDLASEMDIGYTFRENIEGGISLGRYTAEPGADNGSFSAFSFGFYGKLSKNMSKVTPHTTFGIGLSSMDFRTPSTLLAPNGYQISWTAPWTFVGTGLEWKISGFHFDLDARYHLVLAKDRTFTAKNSFIFNGGNVINAQYRLRNQIRYLSVSAGFVFEFPLNN